MHQRLAIRAFHLLEITHRLSIMHISDPAIPFGSIVVIIGANGFMALETCEKALQAGYQVRGTVRDVAKHQDVCIF